MKTINSVNYISQIEFDKNYYSIGEPILHKGAIKETKYYRDLTFEYLKSKYESREVQIAHSKIGYYDYTDEDIYEVKKINFGDALDYFISQNGGEYYLQQTSIPDIFPELLEYDLRPPLMLETDVGFDQNLWIGGAGCITPLHRDSDSNFLVQVRGSKKLILFSPDDSEFLYPREDERQSTSKVNLGQIDYELFPLFEKATPISVILDQGDILYIPKGWWHEVHSLTPNISINWWFRRL